MAEYDFLTNLTADERCSQARFTPLNTSTNADVDGTAVTVAFFVTTICSLTQAFSSPVRGILVYLVQNYFILLGTLWSIHRREFSPFDVTFALRLTSPPHNFVILVCFLWKRCKIISDFLQGTDGIIALILAAHFPFLWLGLGLVLRYSNYALTNSKLCEDTTLLGWLSDILSAFLSFSQFTTPPAWAEMICDVSFVIYFVFLVFVFLAGLLCLRRCRGQAPLEHTSPTLLEWFIARACGHSRLWLLPLLHLGKVTH